jgi:glycosyltransferase involved in cell wall biosynthesis
VTCHDTDAFSPLVGGAHATGLPGFLVKRIADGLRRAAVVVCPSRVTAEGVIGSGLVAASRVAVVPNGVDLEATDAATRDARATPLLGPPGTFVDVLNVGSTIERKRIDLLLKVFAGAARRHPRLRLVRVGGPFTASQERLAADLGVRDRILVLPLIDRKELAAVYQRATLLVATSEREGFGLPVAESLALGTPVLAADLPVVREVAGDAATLVAGADEGAWTSALCELLEEHGSRPGSWHERVTRARSRGSAFSWARYAGAMSAIYRETADGCFLAGDARPVAPAPSSSARQA